VTETVPNWRPIGHHFLARISLACAGDGLGIGNATGDLKTRSGTFWPFIDLMKYLKQAKLPKVVLENVLGPLTTNAGVKIVISALNKLKYRVGAVRQSAASRSAVAFFIGGAFRHSDSTSKINFGGNTQS